MNNPLSFSSVKLDLFSKDDVHLKPASGFIVEAGNQYYLITNWHVVSGGDIHMGEQQETVMKPYLLKTSVHIQGGAGEKSGPLSMGMRKRITVQLYDDNDSPRWIERQTKEGNQHAVDIVALPIQVNLTLKLFSGTILGININKGSWDENADYWTKVSAIPISAIDTDVEYGPPDTVHIIGYPLGWEPDGTDRTSSAFWRTSFIASEIYESGMRRVDTFFIDPCAPEGMTGSPVVGMKNDRLKLLGVYSDRSTAKFDANAGLVCGAWLVKLLIQAS
jgi:Trypsin-like peptidase domain